VPPSSKDIHPNIQSGIGRAKVYIFKIKGRVGQIGIIGVKRGKRGIIKVKAGRAG